MHFHGIGFVGGTYDICRNCQWFVRSKTDSYCVCEEECKGFEQRTRRANSDEKKAFGYGVLVKVFGRRAAGVTVEAAVVRTAKYVLSHASYQKVVGQKFYQVSYFGVLANRVLKSAEVSRTRNCPVCLEGERDGVKVGKVSSMKKARYVGVEYIPKDVGDILYKKVFGMEKLDESGSPQFVFDDEGGGGGHG